MPDVTKPITPPDPGWNADLPIDYVFSGEWEPPAETWSTFRPANAAIHGERHVEPLYEGNAHFSLPSAVEPVLSREGNP